MMNSKMWMLLAVFILLVVVSDARLWMVNLQSDPMGAEALAGPSVCRLVQSGHNWRCRLST